jgi:hypothetical protein
MSITHSPAFLPRLPIFFSTRQFLPGILDFRKAGACICRRLWEPGIQINAAIQLNHLPPGARRFSSSNQFWTRTISVTGAGFICSVLTISNLCPSRDTS